MRSIRERLGHNLCYCLSHKTFFSMPFHAPFATSTPPFIPSISLYFLPYLLSPLNAKATPDPSLNRRWWIPSPSPTEDGGPLFSIFNITISLQFPLLPVFPSSLLLPSRAPSSPYAPGLYLPCPPQGDVRGVGITTSVADERDSQRQCDLRSSTPWTTVPEGPTSLRPHARH